jgi:hypothetical protein
MNAIRTAGGVLLGVLLAMVATASSAMAKGYIDLDETSAPVSPRAVEGVTTGGGSGGGRDVTTTVIEQGYSIAQMLAVAAVTAALAFAIGFLVQRALDRRHRPLTVG